MKKVSIIIPFYNNPDQLKRALNSVFSQSYKNYEVIVIDDGSLVDYKQDTLALYPEFSSQIKYLRQDNAGPGVARQNGLGNAEGDYIQYLDSDDEILPNKLALQVDILQNNPNAIMVYGLSQINSDKNNIHRSKHFKGNEDHISLSAIQKRKWHTSACLWNYDKKKQYWEDLTNGEDVLHDVNAGFYNKNTKVIFHKDIVSNVFMSSDINHLSNAQHNPDKHLKLVRDAAELNTRIKSKVENFDFMKIADFRESVAERFFYEGLKFHKLGFSNDGQLMLRECRKITKNMIKKIELIYCLIIYKLGFVNKLSIRRLFQFHALINPQKLHQRRML